MAQKDAFLQWELNEDGRYTPEPDLFVVVRTGHESLAGILLDASGLPGARRPAIGEIAQLHAPAWSVGEGWWSALFLADGGRWVILHVANWRPIEPLSVDAPP